MTIEPPILIPPARVVETQLASSAMSMPEPLVFFEQPRLPWYRWPSWFAGRVWDGTNLCVLLAVVAAMPVVQLASLGYLLNSAALLARRQPWSKAFPGSRLAGQLGKFALLSALLWLPVWLVTDLSYSAQLLLPASSTAGNWRVAAFLFTLGWLAWIAWAAMRGGLLRHFLWPAPGRFVREVFLPSTWNQASDKLYELVSRLHFARLWWLGARAAVGALIWIAVPVSMMIIGQRADDFQLAPLIGLLGAVSMTVLLMYLPFLQIQMAVDNRFISLFTINTVRRRFVFAPWAHAISLLLLCVLCLPLYLLRIEATPAELVWAPSLVFVLFMLPAKVLLGAAMGYANGRQSIVTCRPRHWTLRWSARTVSLISAVVYVGALYVAQLVAGQGALVMYFQHAFLVPAPLID